MIDPRLWASIPFRNYTALQDFAGTHALWHQVLAEHSVRTFSIDPWRLYPIGSPAGKPWLEAVQAQYVAASRGLGAAPPPDLASFDLSDPVDFASWTWLLSQTAQGLREVAGLS